MEITVEQMMKIEENGHLMGFLKKFMMENAGASAVRRLVDAFGDMSGKRVMIIAGTGNNGGDGMVIARHLAGLGAVVRIFLLGTQDSIRTEEARWNWDLLSKMRSVMIVDDYAADPAPEVLIDAALGTGISGGVREPYASAISFINGSAAFTLAVDVPSGLDATTGEAAGECVRADMTVTFHRAKSGMAQRADVCGRLFVEAIGIPPEAEEGVRGESTRFWWGGCRTLPTSWQTRRRARES